MTDQTLGPDCDPDQTVIVRRRDRGVPVFIAVYSLVIGAVLLGVGLGDHRAAPLWPLGLLLAALPLLVAITTWVNA